MTEIKKGNWWTRKTTFQKVTFIIAVIIFLASLSLFIMIMDAPTFFGQEFHNAIFGSKYKNGWAYLGKVLADGSMNWVVCLVIVFIVFILIFISNFITHLFDNK